MSAQVSLLKNIAARAIACALVVALLGFYPAYLGVMHTMCGIIKGQVVRYL